VASIRSGKTEIPDSKTPDSKIPDIKDSDKPLLTPLVFSKLLINFGLAPLDRVKALNAAANRAARMYLKLSMAS
jgi:hypothetical protein